MFWVSNQLAVSARPEGVCVDRRAQRAPRGNRRCGGRLIRHPEAPTALPLTPLVVAGITRAGRPRQTSSQGFCAGIPRYLIGPFEKQVAKLVAFLQSLPPGGRSDDSRYTSRTPRQTQNISGASECFQVKKCMTKTEMVLLHLNIRVLCIYFVNLFRCQLVSAR